MATNRAGLAPSSDTRTNRGSDPAIRSKWSSSLSAGVMVSASERISYLPRRLESRSSGSPSPQAAPLQRRLAVGEQAEVDQLLLQLVPAGVAERVDDLGQQQVGELLAGPLECLADAVDGVRLAQPRPQLFGQLGGGQPRL